MVTSAKDVLATYGITNHKFSECPLQFSKLSKLEQTIIKKLQQEPMEIDTLSRLLEISASEIGSALSLMQLKSLLFEEDGKYYVN